MNQIFRLPMKAKKLPAKILCDRIVLKRHDLKYSKIMYQAVDENRKRFSKYFPWVHFTKSIRDTQKYIRNAVKRWGLNELFDYGMYERESGKFIGNIGVHSISWQHEHCEIGYWIIGSHEGMGYVSEAVTSLIETCFKMGFNRIEIRCDAKNKRSAAVPKRLGFRLEGKFRAHQFEMNRWRNTLIFALLKTDRFRNEDRR